MSDTETNNTVDDIEASPIVQLSQTIRRSERVVVLTGAGISTESGIPDYRGPNGVWATQTPPTLAAFMEDEEHRRAYWERRREGYPRLLDAQPNPGHRALVTLERAGKLMAIVTQNIDGLHQRAGSSPDRVIELHGTAHRVRCMSCDTSYDGRDVQQWLIDGNVYPSCPRCGGILRTATVLFGEPLPRASLELSIALARESDLLLVVGSSLVVNPAATLPVIAKRNGATFAIVNQSETRHDTLADIRIEGAAGTVLPLAIEQALAGS